jgi:anaerobic magnesium-protoporphyrin IX monomethyl ester cyclase
MAKILFIVNNREQDPLGVMQLSSILRLDGHETTLAAYKNDDIFKTAKYFRPDIIGYSVTTGTEKKLLEINKILKENFKFLSVFGGPHPTFFPDIIKEDGVDAVVRGEAERTIKKIIETMSTGIYETEALVTDLDALPFPDRTLNNLLSLNSKTGNVRTAVFTRGCPFLCAYCFEHVKREIYKKRGGGRYVRYKSVDRAIEEIKLIEQSTPRKYLSYIDIRDSTFNLNKKWAVDFLKKAKEETNVLLAVNVRADLIDEEIAEALKESNVFAVTMGIECGDDFINRNILKKGFTSDVVINAARILRKYKIDYFFDNIIAIPGETPNQALKTLDLSVKLKPRFSGAMIFMPYPKLELTQYAHDKGFINHRFPKIDSETYHVESILNFSEKDKKKFKRLHDLFSIIVLYNLFNPFMRLLICLPLDSFYERLNFAYSKSFKRHLLSPKKFTLFHKTILSFKFIFLSVRNMVTLFAKNIFYLLSKKKFSTSYFKSS